MKKTFKMIILVSFMRHCDNFDDVNNDNDHNADYMNVNMTIIDGDDDGNDHLSSIMPFTVAQPKYPKQGICQL